MNLIDASRSFTKRRAQLKVIGERNRCAEIGPVGERRDFDWISVFALPMAADGLKFRLIYVNCHLGNRLATCRLPRHLLGNQLG